MTWRVVHCHILKNKSKSEETRAYFAKIRKNLFELAREGEINFSSGTFYLLYRLSSFFMRNPDHYARLGDALYLFRLVDEEKTDNLTKKTDVENNSDFEDKLKLAFAEAPQWDDKIEKLVYRFGKGIDKLIIEHSVIFATVYKLDYLQNYVSDLLGLNLFESLFQFVENILTKVGSVIDPNGEKLRKTRDKLIRLTG